ncbi:hypothetical protein CJU90_5244 [Yarrowia sp. C11]|nr:hypothetical protein CJU90_5244 [Yarrowia sp. C11]KAG5365041.1 hypothetical protein CKK34_3872 [Yarrowia sp. E02]
MATCKLMKMPNAKDSLELLTPRSSTKIKEIKQAKASDVALVTPPREDLSSSSSPVISTPSPVETHFGDGSSSPAASSSRDPPSPRTVRHSPKSSESTPQQKSENKVVKKYDPKTDKGKEKADTDDETEDENSEDEQLGADMYCVDPFDRGEGEYLISLNFEENPPINVLISKTTIFFSLYMMLGKSNPDFRIKDWYVFYYNDVLGEVGTMTNNSPTIYSSGVRNYRGPVETNIWFRRRKVD